MSQWNVKPGVDWRLIKADFDAGNSIRECVRLQCARGVKITKRAIEKRRDKEGWDQASQMRAATHRLPSVIAQATGQSISRLRTPETAQKVLESLKTAPNYAVAAAEAGISRATLDEWRKEPEFQELCDQALSLCAAEDIRRIKNAGERDWKAAQYMAERNPMTKGEFAEKAGGGVNIQVNVGIDRAQPETVTVTAEKL
jgi:hypothetical protein